MKGDEILNTEIMDGRESSVDDKPEPMAAFAAHTLQKAKARERIKQDQKHSEPEIPYRQQRKRIEQNLGHVGTSVLDFRGKITDRQAIEQELQDYGVDDVDELNDIDRLYEQTLSPEQVFEKFSGLFTFLGEDTTKGNPNVIEEYQQITDKKEQLKFILSASLPDKVRLFCSDCFDYPNYDDFMQKLQFQQDCINGTAEVWEQEWDEHQGKYIDVQRPLDIWVNPYDVALGLKRNALYSAMIGSPELASVKIATARINDSWLKDAKPLGEAVDLHGFRSGIFDYGDNGCYIGQWAELCDEYKIVFDKINLTYEDDPPEQKEYKAVRKLATWIMGAFEYGFGENLKEAIVAGRLPYEVMRRFKGMRDNIPRSDLHNIERFVGKSGYSKKRYSMKSERSLLGCRLRYIDGLSDDAKQEFLDKENAFEIKKQREWQEKELGRIQHKYDKLISKTRSEELRAIHEQRRQEELRKIEQDVSGRITYFENRTMSGLITDINSRIDLLSRRIEKRKSLAEKAIDLHFKLNVGEKERNYDDRSVYADSMDWINDVPFGVIKRAHKRISDGESVDDVYRLAILETISRSKDTTGILKGRVGWLFNDVKAKFPEWSDEEALRLSGRVIRILDKYNAPIRGNDILNYALDGKIDLDVIEEYPWLIQQYSLNSCGGADVFPAKQSDNAKHKWCSDNSFVWLDGGWGRQTLGKIIFTRLQAGIEESVHDATQWLSAFQIPETAYDIPEIKKRAEAGEKNIDIEEFSMKLFDRNEEKIYLARILSASQSIRGRLNLSTKPQNMSRLFSTPEHIFVYSELVKILKNPEINFEEFQADIQSKIKDYYNDNIVNSDGKSSEWRMSFNEFERKVAESLSSILQTARFGDGYTDRIGDIAQRLNQYGLNRKAYIDDTTAWLVKHTVSPQQSLTKAWADRALAIANGAEDNASEINNWANTNSMLKTQGSFLARNGIAAQDLLTTYEPFVKELTRCYGTEMSARALVKYKEIHNSEKTLPAASIPLEIDGRRFTGEVLAHDDPRGMTIGYDTGCCMTVDGVSRSCIESGYRDSGAGFFAFYDDSGRINAQSYFFTNPEHPEVVVMDNIEANRGRDSDRIIDVYQEFFKQYLKDRFASDPNWQIRQVNVGTQYGDVAKAQVTRLESTKIIPGFPGVYTDARYDQRLLVRLSDEEIEQARREGQGEGAIIAKGVIPRHVEMETIMPLGTSQIPILRDLEKRIYPENMQQYDDDDFVYSELEQPSAERYSFLINTEVDAAKETTGYCIAYEADSEIDPHYNKKVVYIADFGVVPKARGGRAALKGFNELLKRIEKDGIERIEMDARESTSYKFFTSEAGRRYLLRHGYVVDEHESDEDFGNGERTRMISLTRI